MKSVRALSFRPIMGDQTHGHRLASRHGLIIFPLDTSRARLTRWYGTVGHKALHLEDVDAYTRYYSDGRVPDRSPANHGFAHPAFLYDETWTVPSTLLKHVVSNDTLTPSAAYADQHDRAMIASIVKT